MIRRWVIRGLALTLLTLCVVAWVGSYWWDYRVEHCHPSRVVALEAIEGELFFVTEQGSIRPQFLRFYVHSAFGGRWDHQEAHHFMGFALQNDWPSRCDVWVPLWFPTLLSTLLLWFVWRKTRAMPIGGAFPIEVTATAK
jgi:hypothetical protein